MYFCYWLNHYMSTTDFRKVPVEARSLVDPKNCTNFAMDAVF